MQQQAHAPPRMLKTHEAYEEIPKGKKSLEWACCSIFITLPQLRYRENVCCTLQCNKIKSKTFRCIVILLICLTTIFSRNYYVLAAEAVECLQLRFPESFVEFAFWLCKHLFKFLWIIKIILRDFQKDLLLQYERFSWRFGQYFVRLISINFSNFVSKLSQCMSRLTLATMVANDEKNKNA